MKIKKDIGIIELKGIKKEIFTKLMDSLDLPEELVEMLAEAADEKNRREEVVGQLSDELKDKFVDFFVEREDAKIRFQRETEDWHRAFDRRIDAHQKEINKKHDELWAKAYAEVGVEKTAERRFSINRENGTVSELFDEDKEKEPNLFDFRTKPLHH